VSMVNRLIALQLLELRSSFIHSYTSQITKVSLGAKRSTRIELQQNELNLLSIIRVAMSSGLINGARVGRVSSKSELRIALSDMQGVLNVADYRHDLNVCMWCRNFGGNKFVLGNAPLLDILWNESATSTALTTLNLSYNQLSGALSSWNSAPSLGFIQSLL
jgi:hypothetical protein